MKTAKEVCEIYGITKKALRGYKAKELLLPTAKTSAGYWLYDDAAINKLNIILTFAEIGYTREEIKGILALPWNEYAASLDTAIQKLEEKKKRIDGMIQAAKAFKSMATFPDNVMDSLTRADFSKLNNGKPYVSALKDGVSLLGDIPEEYRERLTPLMTLVALLIAVGCLNNEDAGSEKVLACVTDYCKEYKKGMLQKMFPKEGERVPELRFPGFSGDWEQRKFGEMCSIVTKQTGFDYTATIKKSLSTEPSEDTLPYLQTKNFAGVSIDYNTDYYIPKSVAKEFPKINLDPT